MKNQTDSFSDPKPDPKDSASVAESVKSEKSAAEPSTQDRGIKRDASTANIRTPSMQEGKKMKMQ
jgi:hypothetical protein